jgi:hypothetical protein
MRDQRLPHERPPDGTPAASSAANWTLALWVVAAFLGAFVATHYLLQRVLFGGSDFATAVPAVWSRL